MFRNALICGKWILLVALVVWACEALAGFSDTGGFTVDPGETFDALVVPSDKTFVLTGVIVFPLVTVEDPNFIVRYRIEENGLTRFQYNTVGTSTNWSQHFTTGIEFAPRSTVSVVNTTFSTGRTGFQLLGYFIRDFKR